MPQYVPPSTTDGSRPTPMPQYTPPSGLPTGSVEAMQWNAWRESVGLPPGPAPTQSRASAASRDAARRSLSQIPSTKRTVDQQNRYLQLKYEDDLKKEEFLLVLMWINL